MMQAQEKEIIPEMYYMAKLPELCRSEGAEIPVLFRDLISSLCFVVWERWIFTVFLRPYMEYKDSRLWFTAMRHVGRS